MVYSNPCPTHTEIYSRLSCCKMLLCIPITQFIQNEKKLLSKVIYQSMTKSIIPSKKPSKTIKNHQEPLYQSMEPYTIIPLYQSFYVPKKCMSPVNFAPCSTQCHVKSTIPKSSPESMRLVPSLSQWPF